MALEQHDLEQIERLIYKNVDDTAVALARSFERLEDRLSMSEDRIDARLKRIERIIHPDGSKFDEPEDGD